MGKDEITKPPFFFFFTAMTKSRNKHVTTAFYSFQELSGVSKILCPNSAKIPDEARCVNSERNCQTAPQSYLSNLALYLTVPL